MPDAVDFIGETLRDAQTKWKIGPNVTKADFDAFNRMEEQKLKLLELAWVDTQLTHSQRRSPPLLDSAGDSLVVIVFRYAE